MALRKGMIVDKWKVLGRVGAGGMATVWRVEHVVLGTVRALKCLHDNMLKDVAGSQERFLAEAKNVQRIAHPNVVQVFDAGVLPDPDADEGRERIDIPWLVMEFLDGHDLAQEMKVRGARGLPREEVAALLRDACAGIQAAHDKGVVHCDLKPENLFLATVEGRRELKVVDFGISKAITAGRNSITLTQRLLSPIWTSPEQLAGRTVSRETDLWALGLIAFYLLTGRYFWRAANVAPETGKDLVTMILSEVIGTAARMPAASERASELGVASNLPYGFDAWFARCVHPDPTSRFRSARECADGLRAVLAGQAAFAYPSTVPVANPTAPMTVVLSGFSPPVDSARAVTARPKPTAGWVVPAALGGALAVAVAMVLAARTLASQGGAPVHALDASVTALGAAAGGPAPLVGSDGASSADAPTGGPVTPQGEAPGVGEPDAGGSRTSEGAATSARDQRPRPPLRSTRIDDLLNRASNGSPPAPPPSGTLPETPDRNTVRSTLSGLSSSVRACGVGAGGTAMVTITFASSGRVTAASVGGIPPGPVVGCIVQVVRQATLPPFTRATFSVTYPYALN